MTVAELIAKLQTYPQDAAVIYRFCSDWSVMELDDISLLTAEEGKRNVEKFMEANPENRNAISNAIVYRGGRYCYAYSPLNYPEGELPNYVAVVTFPGN